jgi:glycosyltransferase involved in cell wall biosynthesis
MSQPFNWKANGRHVAIFVPTLQYGGVERVMLNLATGFAERGFTVDLVAVDGQGRLRDQVPASVRVVDLACSRVLTSLPGLVRYLRQERPDALIAAMSHSSVIALWARKLALVRTRIIATEHTSISSVLSKSVRFRERILPFCVKWSSRWFDEIVAVSEGVADDLAVWGQVPRSRIKVIYNPVLNAGRPKDPSQAAPHAWFAPNEPPVILGVGRLAPQKGFDVLIRAFARVRQQQMARLIILGEGEQRARLGALARQLGVEADVWLPGYEENPQSYMARARVFVLSSNYEGFGVVLVEALATGVAIVSTDCDSGPREVLNHGQYGTLVPVGDIEALAEAILVKFEHGRQAIPHDWLRHFEVDNAVASYVKLISGDDHEVRQESRQRPAAQLGTDAQKIA